MVLQSCMAELIRNPRVMTTIQVELRSGLSLPNGHQMVTEEDIANDIYVRCNQIDAPANTPVEVAETTEDFEVVVSGRTTKKAFVWNGVG